MASFCSVVAAGNLTRDPETRSLPNGQTVASFTMAINRKWTKDGEKMEEVTFLDVETWGKTADLVGQYCAKGKNIAVEGRLKQDHWEDKESGQKRSKIKLVAERVHFLGSKDDAAPGAPAAHGNADNRAVAHRAAATPVPACSVEDPPF